jgi:lysophospholipase L1-like esterase
MRRSSWLGRIILATVVPCIIVEGLLQVGAIAVSVGARRSVRRRSDGGSHGCAVLCIGDSYTYGLGATKPEAAYPQRLEELLRSNPIDAGSVVVNAGWPGRNSSDLIKRIAGQVEQYQPRYVAILVGANDMWSRPTHATIPGAGSERGAIAVDDGYHFEWRLPRLAALIFRDKDIRNKPGAEPATAHAAERAPAPTPAPSAKSAKTPENLAPLVGAWRCGATARRPSTARRCAGP